MRNPMDLPPVHSDDELLDRWRLLMGQEGFAQRSIWLAWFDEHGKQLPLVTPVDDVPQHPDGELLDGFGEVVSTVVREHAPEGSVAITICRPGSSVVDDDDRAWGRALLEMARRQAVVLRRLHLATAGSVRPLAGDDLV